jgi:uncharacterized damage-inducible protein DinB
MDLRQQLLETWDIHDRINRYLLGAIEPGALTATARVRGRTVGEQLAHLHGVRLMWLKSAAPELMEGLDKVPKEAAADKARLAEALEASGRAVRGLLERALETGRVKGFKPHPTAFLGYLVAHESHHRGQIAAALHQAGHPLSQKVGYGMWEWGVR